MVDKYYIFGYSDYIKNSISDILSLPNVIYFDAFKSENIITQLVHRVFISRYSHLLSRILMPLWKDKYWRGTNIDEDKNSVVILYEINPLSNKQEWIEQMRKSYPKMKFVYIFTNIIDENNTWRLNRILNKRHLYDLVLTFNRSDAEKYGLDYYEGVFSKKEIDTNLLGKAVKSDVYFCGLDKGRMKLLCELYEHLVKQGVNCVFDIIYPQSDVILGKDVNSSGIKLHSELLKNDEMLANVINSKCILEVLVDRTQPGSSLRMCEAIVYRKKLLTDNPFVTEKHFYNDKQMLYFEKPDDIDVDFIYKTIEDADYLPEDMLSPTKLLEYIEKRVLDDAKKN